MLLGQRNAQVISLIKCPICVKPQKTGLEFLTLGICSRGCQVKKSVKYSHIFSQKIKKYGKLRKKLIKTGKIEKPEN
jgi:hypothetical protein